MKLIEVDVGSDTTTPSPGTSSPASWSEATGGRLTSTSAPVAIRR
uniref:Uncharacterized protein n=1 Tax=Arundo donax TaxID=35708 RepID=A0A0A9EWQ3_ARUDO